MAQPILLTPGPLITSAQTKAAMLADWGSWDGAFNELTASVCRDLVGVVHAEADHVCVPLQGSGTFAVEAALGTLVPRRAKVLVPDNVDIANASCGSFAASVATRWCCRMTSASRPAPRASMRHWPPTLGSRTSPRCIARRAPVC
jgi:2-aminoethylphosphonate-pyruvate transaminase